MRSAELDAEPMLADALRELPSEPALVAAIVHAVSLAVTQAVDTRGHASLVVSGGSTPKVYFPALAMLDLPWERVTITLADERWVDPAHADSNERLVRELLLTEHARRASVVPLMSEADSAEAGARLAAERLGAIAHPYDIIVLGMGADTHIASLFPGAAQYARAVALDNLARCEVVVPPPGTTPALPRLSMTLRELLDSRHVLVATRGADKLRAFERALAVDAPLSPIKALLQHARQPVEVLWAP